MKPIIFVDVDNTLYDLVGEVGVLSYILPLPFIFPEPPKHYETPWEDWHYHADGKSYGPDDDLCEAITHLGHEDALAVLGLLAGGDFKAAQKDPELAREIFEETAKNIWWWLVRQIHELMWRSPELVEPYPGAVEGVKRLRERAVVVFTTTRPYPPHEAVLEPWIEHWFGFGRVMSAKSGEEKANCIAHAIRYGLGSKWLDDDFYLAVVIDDNPKVLERVNWHWEKRLTFSVPFYFYSLDKPWAHQFPRNVIPAENWGELAEKVLEVVG